MKNKYKYIVVDIRFVIEINFILIMYRLLNIYCDKYEMWCWFLWRLLYIIYCLVLFISIFCYMLIL